MLYFIACRVEHVRTFLFNILYISSRRDPFYQPELDASDIYPDSLPGYNHRLWCCTSMYLEFSTRALVALTFDTPIRSRREAFFMPHMEFHRHDISFTPMIDVSIH